MNILTLNEISKKGTDKFTNDFVLASDMQEADAILIRSTNMHNHTLNPELLAVARAGAGTNNIPVDKCTANGIVVFNTPGANANAVKELAIASMLLGSRKIVESIEWTKTLKGKDDIEELVETGKKQFVGPELIGKRLGVIGLGAIGVLIANAAVSLGMEVLGYDPYLSVQSAWNISTGVKLATNLDDIITTCDYISIHVPFTPDTKNMFNKEMMVKLKPGCRLMNFSRAELVETQALKDALSDGTIAKYVTDFPNEDVIGLDNVIAIPHLGASTPESEENCAEMAVMQLQDFLKYGVIRNSVNFPNCDSPYTGKIRITLIHKNIPNMVRAITTVFADENLNIDNMVNKSRGDIAYTIVDLDSIDGKEDELLPLLEDIVGMIKVRLI
ncbi:MAG: 3-phosphoglycerate dehydrogenase [Epulopiscium sp. Nuni2H_MBin001]|nr:MAG: 3-phosphoglycerate dehydrogenase [Epulopiscium sp. Nuni2H_MBin001]